MTVPTPERLFWPAKAPGETRIYSITWGDLLVTDTIASVTWTVPTGLTEGTKSTTGYVTAIILSGGTLGTTYDVLCAVTGTSGQIYNRAPQLLVTTR